MSLRATYDILVQFTEFRNIDLYHQGVYYLRAQIYIPGEGSKPNPTRGSLDKNKNKKKKKKRNSSKSSNDANNNGAANNNTGEVDDYEKKAVHEVRPKQIAIPHQFFSLPSKMTSSARGQHVTGSDKLKRPAAIDDVYSFYQTRGFLVQYVEEIMEINDGCVFRLQLPYPYKADSHNKNINPFLGIDLMWADVEEDDNGNIIGLKKNRFKPVARSEFELKGLFEFNNQKPLHHYTPLLFDDTHFCQTGIIVHSTLHNIKFRPHSDQEVMVRKQHRLLSVSQKRDEGDDVDNNDLDNSISNDDNISQNSSDVQQIANVAANNNNNNKNIPGNVNKSNKGSPNNSISTNRRSSSSSGGGGGNLRVSRTPSMGFLNETFTSFLFPCPPSIDIITDGSVYYTSPLQEHLIRANDLYERYVGPLLIAYKELLKFIKLVIENFFPQELHQKYPHLVSITENTVLLNDTNLKQIDDNSKKREEGEGGGDQDDDNNDAVKEKLFSSKIAMPSPNAITTAILQSMNIVAGEIAILWHQFIEIVPKAYRKIEVYLRSNWEKNATLYCKKAIVTQALRKKHLIDPPDLDATETHNHAAMQLREDKKYVKNAEDDNLLRIFDYGMFSKRDNGCILFKSTYDALKKSEYEKYMEEQQQQAASNNNKGDAADINDISLNMGGGNNNNANNTKLHVIVLQHGFQGSQYDMRLFRDYLTFLYPHFKYLIATSNQNDTDLSFEVMGGRLAKEIHRYISEQCGPQGKNLYRLSFVGHSIGSVIIRTALSNKIMGPYLTKCHSFVTLSSPHLGHMFSPNYINTGLWLMKRWKKSLALEQISLTDSRDYKSSFFYQLSTIGGLQHFKKKVLLVGSHSDTYSPYHSARIEMCRAALDDLTGAGGDYRRMLENIWKSVDPSKVEKVDVSFKFEKSNLDTVLGRAAHIKFLDSVELTAILCLAWREIWDD